MNKEVIELRVEQEKRNKQREEIYSIFSQISKFLNANEKKFKKEESILALKNIRSFSEIKRKEYVQIEKEYRKTQVQLCSMCSHEVIVEDRLGNGVCPICKNQFFRDYSNTTKYIINILSYDDRKINLIINSMINEAITSDEEFIEYLEERLEDFANYDDVKVLRRNAR